MRVREAVARIVGLNFTRHRVIAERIRPFVAAEQRHDRATDGLGHDEGEAGCRVNQRSIAPQGAQLLDL